MGLVFCDWTVQAEQAIMQVCLRCMQDRSPAGPDGPEKNNLCVQLKGPCIGSLLVGLPVVDVLLVGIGDARCDELVDVVDGLPSSCRLADGFVQEFAGMLGACTVEVLQASVVDLIELQKLRDDEDLSVLQGALGGGSQFGFGRLALLHFLGRLFVHGLLLLLLVLLHLLHLLLLLPILR